MMCYNGQGAETGRYFYHRHGLGSVVALSQLSASTVQIVESYAYDIHGRVTIMDSAGADGQWLTPDVTSLAGLAVGNPYLFTGRRYDPETRTVGHSGLYYYRARVYHPDLMRFCQPDPIGYADGLNLYAYCLNNPVNLLDPWGLCSMKAITLEPEMEAAYDELNRMLNSADRYNLGAPLYMPWGNDCGVQAIQLMEYLSDRYEQRHWRLGHEQRCRRPGGPDSVWNKFVGNHNVVILEPRRTIRKLGMPTYVLDPWIDPWESIQVLYGDPVEARRVGVMTYEEFVQEYPYADSD